MRRHVVAGWKIGDVWRHSTPGSKAVHLYPPVALAFASAPAPEVVVAYPSRRLAPTKADAAFLASLVMALDSDAPAWLRAALALALLAAYYYRHA